MAPPHPTPAGPQPAPPEPSDEALIARTAAGDRVAFDALAARHLPRLRAAADRVLGDPAAAEDVAQDALSRARSHAGRYDPARAPVAGRYDPARAPVAVWLHRIAADAAIDRLRARRPTAPPPEGIADAGAAADERIEARRRRRALAEAVVLPPARHRAALALTHGQGRAARDKVRVWQTRWQAVADRFADGLLPAAGELSPEGRARPADAARPPPRR